MPKKSFPPNLRSGLKGFDSDLLSAAFAELRSASYSPPRVSPSDQEMFLDPESTSAPYPRAWDQVSVGTTEAHEAKVCGGRGLGGLTFADTNLGLAARQAGFHQPVTGRWSRAGNKSVGSQRGGAGWNPASDRFDRFQPTRPPRRLR